MALSRRGRLALVAALAVLAIGAFAMFLVRQALDGGSLRSAAEVRLSAMLGQPVTIGGMSISIFPRVTISGTEVDVGRNPDARAPAIAIARIEVLPRVWSLFSGPVVIDDVRLEGFTVSVLRDRRGGWHVPPAVPTPTAGTESGLTISRIGVTDGRVIVFDELPDGQLHESSSIDAIETEIRVSEGGLLLSPVTARIGSAAITGEARTNARTAHLEFSSDAIQDADMPALLGLIGSARPEFLRLHAPASASVALIVDRATTALRGKGTVRAPQVGFEPLRLEQFDAPFTLAKNQLVFDPTAFVMNGGTHRGAVTFDLTSSPPRWSIDSRVTGLEIGDFLNTLTEADSRVDGIATVAATLHGRLEASLADTVAGRVQLTIANGVIRQFPLLATINTATRLTEGDARDTHFERLSATLQLAGGRATTSDLVMQAGHIRVAAAGTIGFNRSLNMRGTAMLSKERAAVAIRSVHELTGLRNSRGELEIPLTISGTLDAPSIGLDLKAAIGKGIKDELMRRLRGFIKK